MSDKKNRRWPVQGNKNNYLTQEEAVRAKELFDKYDDTIDSKFSGLSEDDAALYVAWVMGSRISEARWTVRASRGEDVRYDGTFDMRTFTDDELAEWKGSDQITEPPK